MKLLTFHTEEGFRVGIKTERGVLDIARVAGKYSENVLIPESIEQIVEGAEGVLDSLTRLLALAGDAEDDELWLAEDGLRLGPCVPQPGKIICVGLNYRKHAIESKLPIPESPVLFNKFGNSIAAHGEAIQLPKGASQVDYEAELAIVIGKKAKHVSKESALEYVFGYCNANDLSARDLQNRTSQWLLGKSCDGFCPVGPYLVTSDEVGNPNDLRIRSFVNGEVRQDSNTGDMIFACDEIVSYISSYMTLEPGDIILTGTPEGVILGYPKQQQIWLQAGDEATIEIEKLGSLTNRFQNEA
ncbi:2-keto-4-pentenoate hydratase [Brevibacillus reuszeri]|uniref:2-keto-4-pentenoate hydratase n=1 Tax=Brevibacillus reuszeri TaxID=54915 RepID=A0A0K9YL69_9BACL|nr:fumarylacetoacetate hydrolase family protein [Brevibacillus reuszeri]KNB69401.1 5-carboxymethyl-2-hydroxymuconate isomerase [Brevibacillus reuszeri]MED1860285.1 fumarylacetoacetate hydrolase family protein [Brevibacillus reuszeri]GED70826.1 2-keto-4-pentenoate hydratase [Brevibacillus reuszeri]